MPSNPIVDLIIPAFNEEDSIAKVIGDLPSGLVRDIIVANNGSTDQTATKAREAGAVLVDESQRGYGKACLKAMDRINQSATPPDIVVFVDGDYSDYPEEIPLLIEPIVNGEAKLVIGSRSLGVSGKGSMTTPQRFGNWLATSLQWTFYKVRFTDLGPFRAITYSSLIRLDMKDENDGWTVEMQLKAAKMKLNCTEVAVSYRKRIGTSKASGTIKGTILAGYKILFTIFRYLGT